MNRTPAFSLACSLLLAAPLAFSQAPGGPPPGGPPQVQFGPGGGMHRGLGEGPGMGILPHGAWWKNPSTVTALNLTADQQKRMDDIFQQTRPQLLQMKTSLEQEQGKLEPMLNAGTLDQAGAYAEIAKIADLRAELEKANAKMLLNLRGVLSADQWTKLQAQRALHHADNPEGFRGHRGPDGPSGPPPGFE